MTQSGRRGSADGAAARATEMVGTVTGMLILLASLGVVEVANLLAQWGLSDCVAALCHSPTAEWLSDVFVVLPYLTLGIAFGAAGANLLLKRRAWWIPPAGLAATLCVIIGGAAVINALVVDGNAGHTSWPIP